MKQFDSNAERAQIDEMDPVELKAMLRSAQVAHAAMWYESALKQFGEPVPEEIIEDLQELRLFMLMDDPV